jgi:hypothetical protein
MCDPSQTQGVERFRSNFNLEQSHDGWISLTAGGSKRGKVMSPYHESGCQSHGRNIQRLRIVHEPRSIPFKGYSPIGVAAAAAGGARKMTDSIEIGPAASAESSMPSHKTWLIVQVSQWIGHERRGWFHSQYPNMTRGILQFPLAFVVAPIKCRIPHSLGGYDAIVAIAVSLRRRRFKTRFGQEMAAPQVKVDTAMDTLRPQ